MIPRGPRVGGHGQMTGRALVPGDRHPPRERMGVTGVLDPMDRLPAAQAATWILSPVQGW